MLYNTLMLSERLREQFPMPEDWIALQGGRPRVFRPSYPGRPWEVIHVYEEHEDHDRRFQSGIVVPTLYKNTKALQSLTVERADDSGDVVTRDIVVPSFMNRNVHGDRCAQRSREAGGQGYERLTGQEDYAKYLDLLKVLGMTEVRLGLGADGFQLKVIPGIAPPAPLAE